MLFSKPTHGRAPEKSNEIATSDRALKDLGVKPKVGEKVKISYRLEDAQEYSYEMIVSGWWEATDELRSFMLVSKEYMDQHDEIFERTRKLDFELGRYSAEVFLKNKQNMKEKLEEEVQKLGGQFDDEFAENYTPIVINDTSAELNILAAIFLILLFLLCSYLLIYNIFDIAVVKDIQKYTKAHMKTDYLAANAAAFSITRGYVYRSDGVTEDFVKFIEKLSGIEEIGYIYKNTKEDSNVSFDYGLLKFDSIESYYS